MRRRRYIWVRLREKANDILDDADVAGLWNVTIAFAPGEKGSPEEKQCLCLSFEPDKEAIARRAALEGKYVLSTSLPAAEYPPAMVDRQYRYLQLAERAFRHIKSYLKLRSIFHHLRRRIRAHVLICFLGYYLVKRMELELRAAGETSEVEPLLRRWDKLCLVQHRVQVGDYVREECQWSLVSRLRNKLNKSGRSFRFWQSSKTLSTYFRNRTLGENGRSIQKQLQSLGWWHAVGAYRRRLEKGLAA